MKTSPSSAVIMGRLIFVVIFILGVIDSSVQEVKELGRVRDVFAFTGDSFNVLCNLSTSLRVDEPFSDEHFIQISVYRDGKRYRIIASSSSPSASPSSSSSSSSTSTSSSTSSSSSSSPSSSLLSLPTSSTTMGTALPVIGNNTENITRYFEAFGLVNVTQDLIGKSTVVCETVRSDIIHSMDLYVQDEIGEMVNISSVFHYADYVLDVQWDWNWHYVEKFTNITVVWSAGQRPTLNGFSCTKQDPTSCRVTGIRFPNTIYFMVIVQIHQELQSIFTTQERNTTESMIQTSPSFRRLLNFSVEPLKSVKPRQPTDLTLSSRTSRCVNATWADPPFFANLPTRNATHLIVVKDVKEGNIIISSPSVRSKYTHKFRKRKKRKVL